MGGCGKFTFSRHVKEQGRQEPGAQESVGWSSATYEYLAQWQALAIVPNTGRLIGWQIYSHLAESSGLGG